MPVSRRLYRAMPLAVLLGIVGLKLWWGRRRHA